MKTYSKNASAVNHHEEIQNRAPGKTFYVQTTVNHAGDLVAAEYDDTQLGVEERQAIENYLAAKGLSLSV